MKKVILLLFFLLFVSNSLLAMFCFKCGKELPDNAGFCMKCGSRQPTADKSAPKADQPVPKADPWKPSVKKELKEFKPTASKKSFRTKTDLYIYAKKGDETNILKKNFLFKPRRHKLYRNTFFVILEDVDSSCLVETVPDEGKQAQKGWVLHSELLSRTDWESK